VSVDNSVYIFVDLSTGALTILYAFDR